MKTKLTIINYSEHTDFAAIHRAIESFISHYGKTTIVPRHQSYGFRSIVPKLNKHIEYCISVWRPSENNITIRIDSRRRI